MGHFIKKKKKLLLILKIIILTVLFFYTYLYDCCSICFQYSQAAPKQSTFMPAKLIADCSGHITKKKKGNI